MVASKTAACFQQGVRFQDGTLQTTAAFTTPPGGLNGDIQFNNAGVFGGYTLVPLKNGGTHADLSATGGTSFVLRQSGVGADITVGQLSYSEISGTPQLPQTFAAVTNKFLTSYNAVTGLFTAAQPDFSNLSGSIALTQTPLTTLGDILYVNVTPALARLAGNTTLTKMYLSQTGTGTISANPVWAQIAAADVSGLAAIATSGKWSDLQSATAALTLSNATNATTFNQTSGVTWSWLNTTAATVSVSQSSPIIKWAGRSWSGAGADTEESWTWQAIPGAGLNATTNLKLTHAGSTGVPQITLPFVASASVPQIAGVDAKTGVSIGVNVALPFIVQTSASSMDALRAYCNGTLSFQLNVNSTDASAQLVTSVAGGPIFYSVTGGFGNHTYAMHSFGSGSDWATTDNAAHVAINFGAKLNTASSNSPFITWAPTAGSGTFAAVLISPIVNMTGTASGSYTGLKIAIKETALLGTGHKLIEALAGTTGVTSKFSVDNSGTLSNAGGRIVNRVAKAGNYTATAADYVITFTASGFTLVLDSAVAVSGTTYRIKIGTAAGAGATLTIAPNNGKTIDGMASTTLSVVGQAIDVIYDGTANWEIF